MVRLSPLEYPAVLPLLRACHLHGHLAFAHALLENRQSGQIFVDTPTAPGSTLVCSDSGFYLAFGDQQVAGLDETVQALRSAPRAEANSVLFGTSPAWDRVLTRAFAPGGARPVRRLGFEYLPSGGRPPLDWREYLPAGLHAEPLSARLAEGIVDGSRTGGFGIDPWFIRVAGGPQAYAAAGLGIALLDGEQIAALCGYCGLGNGEAELEVGAVPAYQGRGLATLASAAFIEQCALSGWKPVYTCASDNQPSIAVAHKLGFSEVEEIIGFQI
jgi:hypothetical protein